MLQDEQALHESNSAVVQNASKHDMRNDCFDQVQTR